MTKSHAAKQIQIEDLAATEGFDSETIVAENDPSNPEANRSVEELRERIKAARLENMMARQLEGELSIDPMTLDLSHEHDRKSDTDFSESRSRDPDNWTKSRFRTSRQDCEVLVNDYREHAAFMNKMVQRSNAILDYLDKVEEEFGSMQTTELELRERTRELERVEKQRAENLALIEKQSKQIDMLEQMRKSASANYEAAKREIDEVQSENTRQKSKVNEAEALIARLERENVAVNEKFEDTLVNLEKTNANVNSLRQRAHDQDRQAAQIRAEFSALTSENETILNELSSLQLKYNELNKKSLEQQGQHYSRINELEDAVRELRNKYDRAKREKEEIFRELEAANNLLVLHEEMISTLSSKR